MSALCKHAIKLLHAAGTLDLNICLQGNFTDSLLQTCLLVLSEYDCIQDITRTWHAERYRLVMGLIYAISRDPEARTAASLLRLALQCCNWFGLFLALQERMC